MQLYPVPTGSYQEPIPQPKRQKKQSFTVGRSHTAILQAVYKYQMLTCEQLRVLCGYSKNSIERVQRLTKQLTDTEYLISLSRPVVRGKAPLVYTLARKGLNYLKTAGFDVRDYFRPSQEQEKSYLFLEHTLALNDFLISASLLSKSAPDYSLISFIHERTLKQTPYKVEIDRAGKKEIITLIPDAWLDFRAETRGQSRRFCVLLELDRGTVETKNFKRKLRALIEFVNSGAYTKMFGAKAVTVGFATTAGEKRLAAMRSWTKEELEKLGKLALSDMFLFTALPQELTSITVFLEPVWFTPTSDTPVVLLDMS